MAEATGGKLSIKVYPNASLLPVSVIKRAVQMGRMQIGETLISLHDNEDPIFGIDVVPFLATTGHCGQCAVRQCFGEYAPRRALLAPAEWGCPLSRKVLEGKRT